MGSYYSTTTLLLHNKGQAHMYNITLEIHKTGVKIHHIKNTGTV